MKFVFDLDGTICFKGNPLSDPIIKALDRIAMEGHEVIFASARPIRDLLPILPVHLHHAPMIGGNGGFVYKGGKPVSSIQLEASIGKRIIDLLMEYEAAYLMDSLWDYSYTGDPEHPIRKNLDPEIRAKNVRFDELKEIVKVVVLSSKDSVKLINELEKLPIRMYTHGTEDIIDISPDGIDKWVGLQALGLKPGEYIAFGNDINDIPMFQYAHHSICVGDHAALREMASESIRGEETAVVRKIDEIAVDLRSGNNRFKR
ncbi:HAD-IIB family hydrolase [Paenibacillus pasadenensis]|uniref:Putative hydrolase n=1 Tax=Paenibacillus pasadenensis TaxID=217090 RepID=A0A2N5N6K5_9BACL|nr:HAD family hydrolase [Paenibacillus pasadenensis]PLT45943.1 putative hydrolase [Paenibacillus pasadenensis]